jgi:hypothetical protein
LLLQVAALELYLAARSRGAAVIAEKDLGRFLGDPDLLRAHVEALAKHLFREQPSDRAAFEKLLTRTYRRQAGGSHSTALVPVTEMAREWGGKANFEQMVRTACLLGLLRVGTFAGPDGGARRCLSLGHDALARVAAELDRGPCNCRTGRWKKATFVVGLAFLAVLSALTALVVSALADDSLPVPGLNGAGGAGDEASSVIVDEESGQKKRLPNSASKVEQLSSQIVAATVRDAKKQDRSITVKSGAQRGSRTWTIKDRRLAESLSKQMGQEVDANGQLRIVVTRELESELLEYTGQEEAAATFRKEGTIYDIRRSIKIGWYRLKGG